jgi:hypothetical protein
MMPSFTNQLKEFIAKHISSEFNKMTEHQKDTNKDVKKCPHFQHQDWIFVPSKHPTELKTINGHEYHWCNKYNHAKGQWAQAHTNDTHIDNFKPTGHHNTNPCSAVILKNNTKLNEEHKNTSGQQHLSFAHSEMQHDEQQQSAQLSLSDGLQQGGKVIWAVE